MAEPLEIVFFTREDCPLCDEGFEVLQAARQIAGRASTVRQIIVDTDPELVALYGDKVPVIVFGGRVRAWGRFSRAWLVRELHAE